MVRRLLFPTDGSEAASTMFDYVLDVAAVHDATVHLLSVADTNRDSLTRLGGEIVDVLETEGTRAVEGLASRAASRGVDTVETVVQGDPAPTIVDYADAYDIDAIAMPTRGRRGLSRFLLGSVTERVVVGASVPVIAVSPDEARPLTYPPQTVLVPMDGSEGAERAHDAATTLAAETGATLHLLHVVETPTLAPSSDETLDASASDLLTDAAERARDAGVETVHTSVRTGRPAASIRSAIVDNVDVDLVALGVTGASGFGRSIMGGVASKTLRTSPVPTLLCGGSVRSDDDSVDGDA